MASSPSELEQRVSVLEAEMDKLKRKLDQLDDVKPWWEQITGTFEDDPIYDEAMLLSRNLGDFSQIPNLQVEDWTSPG